MESGLIFDSPEKIRQSVEVIHRTALKMGSIIDALLLLASVRRSDDVHREPFDVQATAREACARLGDLAKRHNATITFTSSWQVALGYPQWIEEVWMNYISNAIKYGGDEPRIEIGCEVENQTIKYWVRDHGEGIPTQRQKELFIQFSRLAPQISEGHGLGLSIVKRIVERLGGKVGYLDAEGGGGCFWFTLPTIESRSE
jgi:signal transduction histidine kinase